MENRRNKTEENETIAEEPGLFSPERRQQIMRVLEREQRATVAELSRLFSVSEVTIRKDLTWLETQGLALRTHGGAIPNTSAVNEIGYAEREQLRRSEKQRIARAAASYVQDGDTVVLDASSTTLAMVPYLGAKQELTIVTNGVRTGMELLQFPGISVLMLGGMLRRESASLVGNWGRALLEQVNISKAFVGARGLTLSAGLTDVNSEEVEIKRAIVGAAKEVIAVIDSSKWGLVTLATFCPLERLTRIITDPLAPPTMIQQARDLGIDVQLVG
ncbi:DeoR/GlpR family DNA-binding transcription regulator [Ktedonospora formicarum]|uniref:DeoR family transcriptional regulator n=1 Tax=Ktedonospora formicarum TaxID=2778364 RepID=A0A8J3IA75_9CHLR|nr:DeoR/GlpR family DNA-binding transcription regulator [Ktedonospora formicarum]GHO49620.1 DeoR family transcriptional regulator [Ktedonospora formicarum]